MCLFQLHFKSFSWGAFNFPCRPHFGAHTAAHSGQWSKKEKTGQIIDVSVPNDFGLNRAERAKLMKYQDLINDLKKTLSVKEIEIIPNIIGATGLLKSNSASYIEKIPGELNQSEIQMGAITGTVSTPKRALAYEQRKNF